MKKQHSLFVFTALLSLVLLVPACKDDDTPTDPCASVTCENGGTCADGTCFCPDGFSGPNCEVEDPCHEANTNNEWGYDDFGGPACWNDVCCGTGCSGNHQSPINIVNAVLNTSLPDLVLDQLEATTTKIIHKGHTIEFEQEPGTFLTYGVTENGLDNQYTLGQFHFHAKSEHQVGGNHAPLEAHLVCRNVWKNEYIVLGVMFEEGASNPFLAQFVDHLPTDITQPPYVNDDLLYNAFDLLPANKSYFTYSGSLTTPPCSETVTWIMMENKVQATAAEIEAFTKLLNHNYRPVQPLNGRVIGHVQL
ncbi:MAG: carbonic anhydrase family protein [Saprospiraceae bacterium]|nr:carbonic anhydrase family protein [Saprospiraceae bacterium]MCF8249354.1 carbonic anhydrase family protein [Saprospiraceae bacterium]MCF8279006.1 carbonic anhydrase family protein [Bacteroidales bacterium]MCF8311483.1 carbonic anhydrase family protein [Saprospiraceae bacterium]MCF8439973.1 carbonic anhydrase family protein [Saprospiraceae bacterium]